jgi:phage recombination protein Bet
MSTQLQNAKPAAMPSLAMAENELINVLRNSLYPGAQDESIKLVIGYCKASGLDPIQKPVHIVPMWDSKAKGMRDVIMPGIGAYRTQAARSGEYAGVSDAEYGPDIDESIGGQQITYPAWCRVTVKRLLQNGQIAEFSATERWKENYAVKGGQEKSIAPNAMWSKRPYAQIAKCAEAQALRKAFPEYGSQPTADEMEGKQLNEIDVQTGEAVSKSSVEQKPLEYYTDAEFKEKSERWYSSIKPGAKADDFINFIQSRGKLFTEAQILKINEWQDLANESA